METDRGQGTWSRVRSHRACYSAHPLRCAPPPTPRRRPDPPLPQHRLIDNAENGDAVVQQGDEGAKQGLA